MKTQGMTFWTADRIMQLIIGLAIGGVLVWLLVYLSDVLLPFFVACFVAYLLQPLVERNRRLIRRKGRILASIMTVLEVLIVVVAVVWIFMPQVVKELDSLGAILREIRTGQRPLPAEFAGVVDFVERKFSPEELKSMLSEFHLSTLISRGSSLLDESLGVIFQALSWALTLIYVLFILIDYPQIVRGFKLIIPYKYRPGVMGIVREVQESMNHYFRGQGCVALWAMVFYCIGFSIVGLPLAIPMGVLVGLLYMIPYFQYVTLLPVAVICFIYSLGGEVSFMSLFGKSLLVYVCSQSVCDYVLTPHIMGKEMGLNPAVILLSLSVWGSLLGIIGMIIALPVTSLIMAYYERYISNPRPQSHLGGDSSDES